MSAHFNEVDSQLLVGLKQVSLAMFRKNFFGIFHGSISARLTKRDFVINTKLAVFDNLDSDHLMVLNTNRDYRWNESSMDTAIHAQIYLDHSDAKFIAYAMPPYSVSYSLLYDHLRPLDFFGKSILGEEVAIWDPKDCETWYKRAPKEISEQIIDRQFLLIKGYGVYVFDRDLHALAKKIAVIENTCKILHFQADLRGNA